MNSLLASDSLFSGFHLAESKPDYVIVGELSLHSGLPVTCLVRAIEHLQHGSNLLPTSSLSFQHVFHLSKSGDFSARKREKASSAPSLFLLPAIGAGSISRMLLDSAFSDHPAGTHIQHFDVCLLECLLAFLFRDDCFLFCNSLRLH